MMVSEERVGSLGEFVERFRKLRELWAPPGHEELWFRGESKNYGDTMLRPEVKKLERDWRKYAADHPSYGWEADEWEAAFLPADEEDLKEMYMPRPPVVMDFALITRRIAAQRSRFIAFGTDPRLTLRGIQEVGFDDTSDLDCERCAGKSETGIADCGVTESVIYPDLDGLGREMRQVWEDRR